MANSFATTTSTPTITTTTTTTTTTITKTTTTTTTMTATTIKTATTSTTGVRGGGSQGVTGQKVVQEVLVDLKRILKKKNCKKIVTNNPKRQFAKFAKKSDLDSC